MKNWTVRRQIIFGFSIVILIMVALTAFALFRLSIIKTRTTAILTDALPSLTAIGRIDSLSKEHYSLVERHALISDKGEERRIESAIVTDAGQLDEAFTEYDKSIYTSEEHQLFSTMTAARKAYTDRAMKLINAGSSADAKDAAGLLEREIDPAYQVYTKAIDDGVALNQRYGEEAGNGIHDAVDSARTGILLALSIAFILACISGYFLIRDLTVLFGSVRESGIRVATSATEIAATSQEQLATSNEVAATTSEVGATSKEISATSKELLQTVKELTEVAERTASLAGSGQAGLARMRSTMQQIMEASASINAKLGVLSEKASNIGTVVTTITKVADQTNLLSLNAAIEAEKAGEYGRGFAVVSTEIRRLADQTALATNDIEQMVKEIQSAVSAGVMGMDKFSEEVRRGVEAMHQVSEELTQIIQQVQGLTASFETVNEGMQSQSTGAQQISEALTQLTEASRQTVDSLRQSNQAIEQLNVAARTMQNGVARFASPA